MPSIGWRTAEPYGSHRGKVRRSYITLLVLTHGKNMAVRCDRPVKRGATVCCAHRHAFTVLGPYRGAVQPPRSRHAATVSEIGTPMVSDPLGPPVACSRRVRRTAAARQVLLPDVSIRCCAQASAGRAARCAPSESYVRTFDRDPRGARRCGRRCGGVRGGLEASRGGRGVPKT